MDQEITTCPQCGATVHAPARFCVTCGIRLPETIASAGTGEPVDPRAGWASRDVSGWTTPPPGAFDFEDPTIIDVEPMPVTTPEPPVSRWNSWPSQPERTEQPAEPIAAQPPSNEDDYVVTSTTAAPVTEQFEVVTAETATPDPEDLTEAEEAPITEPVESEITTTAAPAEITPAVEAPFVAGDQGDETDAANEPLDIEIGEDLPDDFEPAGWTEAEEIEEEVTSEPAAPEEVYAATTAPHGVEGSVGEGSSSGESDPIAVASGIDRANELLDELRSLLPGLVREVPAPVAEEEPVIEEPPAPAVDLEAIRAAAIEARGEISFDNFAALRTVIDEATTKPRDVEVMLKLSQRVDDIVALIAERDRLQLAFDSIVERLHD